MNPFLKDLIYHQGYQEGAEYGAIIVLLLFLLLQVKHLIADFFIQNKFPYMWMNKHKFFHWGGWLHAGTHAVGSFGVLALVRPPGVDWMYGAAALCVAELFLHFGIDLIKMRIGIWKKWACNTHPQFWNLLGIDQFLHQAT